MCAAGKGMRDEASPRLPFPPPPSQSSALWRKHPLLTSTVLCWELSKVLVLQGVPAKRTPLHSLACPARSPLLYTFSAYPVITLFPWQEETMVFAPGNVFTYSFFLCVLDRCRRALFCSPWDAEVEQFLLLTHSLACTHTLLTKCRQCLLLSCPS